MNSFLFWPLHPRFPCVDDFSRLPLFFHPQPSILMAPQYLHHRLPELTKQEAKAALLEYVSTRYCYGKSAAKQMTIDKIDNFCAFHVSSFLIDNVLQTKVLVSLTNPPFFTVLSGILLWEETSMLGLRTLQWRTSRWTNWRKGSCSMGYQSQSSRELCLQNNDRPCSSYRDSQELPWVWRKWQE